MQNKIKIKDCLKHKTKKNILNRFLIILTILIIYFSFAVWHYGLNNGIFVTLLTWSLFVLCTPIADAGFLLDFPIRIFTKIKMLYSEISVWIIAISLNIIFLQVYPSLYEKTIILQIFKTILITPFPYWTIILLSVAGTFLSISFGDELLDVFNQKQRNKYHSHKRKHWAIIFLFMILVIFFIYYYLINRLNIKF